MYLISKPPKAGRGFSASDKELIAIAILDEVNEKDIDLWLEEKMPRLYDGFSRWRVKKI